MMNIGAMDPIFETRCNCLYDNENISVENLERLSRQINSLGIPFDTEAILTSVKRMGNWVGGKVYVFQDKVVFSMNRVNAKFQQDASDVIVPTSMIRNARLGKMLIIAKTVDCEFMGSDIRFRCFGQSNDKLFEAIKSVADQS